MDGFEGEGEGGQGGSSASYNFAGVPGSGTVSAAGANTVTETITDGGHSTTLTFTEVAGSTGGLYQLTSQTSAGGGDGGDGGRDGGDGHHGGSSGLAVANAPTYAFQYDAATGSTMVTETVSHANSAETLTYVATGSAYNLTQDVVTYSTSTAATGESGSYSFSAAGAITVTESWGASSYSHSEAANPTATFTGLSTNVGSAQNIITETYVEGHGVTTVTFSGSATAGYTIASTSTTYVSANGATPVVDVNPEARADFNFTAGTVSWVDRAGTAGTAQSLTANSHVAYADLGGVSGIAGVAGDFVGATETHGSHQSYDLFYSATGPGGEYMQVAHGSGAASAVSLTGIATQLAGLNALHTLIT